MTAGASNSPVFDFTSLDFTSMEEDLIRFSQVTFPEDLWTDYNVSNFASGLIENMAYSTDLLAYTANAQNLETIVTTLIREQNFRNIAKSLDYRLKSAAPSSSTERCTLDPSGSYPFTISKHLQFASRDNTIFQPDADVAVGSYPGGGYVDVPITQGEEHFEEALGTTNGRANQVFPLGVPFVIDGTLSVQVGLMGYTEVPNFISVGPTERVYITETTEDGTTSVVFGDGINGIIPPKNQAVKSTYKTGGGINTNLASGVITRVYGSADGSPVPTQILSATNVSIATGGASKQSLSNAKQNLPLSLKASDRGVAAPDYAALAVKLVPGILKANAVTGRPYAGSSPILLFVVPNGGGNPSDSLRNRTIANLKDKRLAGKRIRVLDPVYVSLLIESDSFMQKNAPALDMMNKQRRILADKYDIEAVDFGATFDLQDVYDDTAPSELPGLQRAFYRTFTVKPYYARHVNTPTTGNGTVEWIATNLDTVKRREWLIRVIPPSPPVNVTRFQVLQRRLGVVTGVTDTLVTDDSASYETNELSSGGWVFHPRPEDTAATFNIVGNTATSITTASGLLVETEPDDPYVVEKTEAGIGKILRTTVTANVASSAVVPVASVDSWQVGDLFHLSDNPLDYYEVTAVGVSSITADRPLSTAIGAHVDYVWRSADESVKFSVVDASTAFVAGDELYVDTYARAGDLALRPENFPLLAEADLFINPIGGVR